MIRPSSAPDEDRLWKCVTITVQRTSGAIVPQSPDTSGSVQAIETIEVFERRDLPRFVRLLPRDGLRATALAMLRAIYPVARWEWGGEEAAENGAIDIEVHYPEAPSE